MHIASKWQPSRLKFMNIAFIIIIILKLQMLKLAAREHLDYHYALELQKSL